MSLNRMQRVSIRRAQAGDWKLADAMELLAPGRAYYNGDKFQFGCYLGGRLQAFAYGINHDEADDIEIGDNTDAVDSDFYGPSIEIRYIVGFNDDLIWSLDEDQGQGVETQPAFAQQPGMTLVNAHEVIEAFQAAAMTPTQHNIFQEAAPCA